MAPLPFKLSKQASTLYKSMYAALKKQYPRATQDQIQVTIIRQLEKNGFRLYQGTLYSPQELQVIAARLQKQQTQRAPARNPTPGRSVPKRRASSGEGIWAMGVRLYYRKHEKQNETKKGSL